MLLKQFISGKFLLFPVSSYDDAIFLGVVAFFGVFWVINNVKLSKCLQCMCHLLLMAIEIHIWFSMGLSSLIGLHFLRHTLFIFVLVSCWKIAKNLSIEYNRRAIERELLIKWKLNPIEHVEYPRTRFKLLSFNVFLRPPFVNDRGGDKKHERLVEIADMLCRSDLDAVCMQEIFGNFHGRRGALIEILHKYSKFQYFYFPKFSPLKWSIWPYTYFHVIDSGLLICSRFPIIDADTHIFDSAHSDFSEIFVQKAICHAVLDVNGHSVHLFNTHIQAGEETYKGVKEIRLRQTMDAFKFMEKRLKNINRPAHALESDLLAPGRSLKPRGPLLDEMRLLGEEDFDGDDEEAMEGNPIIYNEGIVDFNKIEANKVDIAYDGPDVSLTFSTTANSSIQTPILPLAEKKQDNNHLYVSSKHSYPAATDSSVATTLPPSPEGLSPPSPVSSSISLPPLSVPASQIPCLYPEYHAGSQPSRGDLHTDGILGLGPLIIMAGDLNVCRRTGSEFSLTYNALCCGSQFLSGKDPVSSCRLVPHGLSANVHTTERPSFFLESKDVQESLGEQVVLEWADCFEFFYRHLDPTYIGDLSVSPARELVEENINALRLDYVLALRAVHRIKPVDSLAQQRDDVQGDDGIYFKHGIRNSIEFAETSNTSLKIDEISSSSEDHSEAFKNNLSSSLSLRDKFRSRHKKTKTASPDSSYIKNKMKKEKLSCSKQRSVLDFFFNHLHTSNSQTKSSLKSKMRYINEKTNKNFMIGCERHSYRKSLSVDLLNAASTNDRWKCNSSYVEKFLINEKENEKNKSQNSKSSNILNRISDHYGVVSEFLLSEFDKET